MESPLDKYRQFYRQSPAPCRKMQKSGQTAGFSAFIQGRRIFQMRQPQLLSNVAGKLIFLSGNGAVPIDHPVVSAEYSLNVRPERLRRLGDIVG